MKLICLEIGAALEITLVALLICIYYCLCCSTFQTDK